MRKSDIVHGALVLILCLVGAEIRAQEGAVPPDKIPAVVMKALLARFPRARIDKSTRAVEDNVVIYDIEFTQGTRKCEADIRENGTYVNFEQAIEARNLPRVVRDAIEKRYPRATLKEVMEETEVKGKEERRSAYEIVLVTSDKKDEEVRVSPDGRILEDTGVTAPGDKR
jgi:hypothetical protein